LLLQQLEHLDLLHLCDFIARHIKKLFAANASFAAVCRMSLRLRLMRRQRLKLE
jgi:hypothetical protein